MSVTIQVAGKTDVGCVRTNNEDNFGYDTRHGIFVVCDGMGGMAAGEVASKLGVDTILDYFRRAAQNGNFPEIGRKYEDLSQMANALASSIHLANSVIHEAAATDSTRSGMGSTIVGAYVKDKFLSIGHVGDSRIYRIRKGSIEQLTEDHSLVMEQVRRGLISPEEADRSDMQNIIIRALGSEETVEPDLEDLVLEVGDILLLACDGLTKHVKKERILEIIQASRSLEQAVEGLIGAAKQGGGTDNITCVMVRAVELPWYRRLFGSGKDSWQSST
jgi:protein phosphatase